MKINSVTPRAGVWIEMVCVQLMEGSDDRHSPCGSVD